MRRPALALLIALAAVVSLLPTATASAQAAAPSPAVVSVGEVVTVRGTGWPRIEFCRPSVAVLWRGHFLGVAPVTTSGRFTFRWTVPTFLRHGARRLFIEQQCESGQTGDPLWTRREVWFRVR